MGITNADTAWIGILDAVGMVFVFVLWLLLRDAGDRVRALAAMVGATLLAVQLSSAVSVMAGLASRLAASAQIGGGDDDVRNFTVALVALVAALAVVVVGHRWVAPVEDADEPVAAAEPLLIVGTAEVIENGNHDDDYDDEEYVPASRPDLSGWAGWFDVALLAFALALPTGSFSSLLSQIRSGGDLTVLLALNHVVSGLLVGALFLVLLAHREIDSTPLLAATFGLVIVGTVLGHVFTDAMQNEVWVMTQIGLAAGLLIGVGWPLIRPALTADRTTALTAVVVVAVLLAGSTVVSTRVFIEQQEARQNQFFEDFSSS